MAVLGSAIRSVLRIRPPHTDKTLRLKKHQVIVEKNNQEIQFVFDDCYGSKTSQQEIYQVVEPYLDNIARGINTTVMAYGATGSGKTYTMSGTDTSPGLVPRIAASLFGKYYETLSILFTIRLSMSYMEVYNEKVYDLLSDSRDPLPVREDAQGRVIVPGLEEKNLANLEAFNTYYRDGHRRRKMRRTLLNTESSRSHSLLTLIVSLATDVSVLRTKINLVDLAGSENNRRTGNEGISMVESASINRSLFVLNKVVDSLGKGESRIPYRDSKLTRLLSDSLGGTSDCILILTVSGDTSCETLSSLAFAGKSRQVRLLPTPEKVRANPWTPKPSAHSHAKVSSKVALKASTKTPTSSTGTKFQLHTSQTKSHPQPHRSITPTTSLSSPAGPVTTHTQPRSNLHTSPPKSNPIQYTLDVLIAILNSQDFLKIKSLPQIGDRRADKILTFSKTTSITNMQDLIKAGIPKKVVQSLSASVSK
ncbi:kinesin family member 22 [Nematocida homosporus]|uniref:kinesin family member 22 n=1 Tax=Nematocida homosporus TaxID=1912981 RepID=UPI00222041D7|nr:kinesin family member 22 [Nematocida homosporus]KAI5187839.1 kinesin family member 22 [Nematocida homosporus]